MPKASKGTEMRKDDQLTVDQKQTFFVAKSNDLIQQTRYSLSLQQNKIMLFLISKIRPFDTGDEVYPVSIREFCKVCNIDYNSGKNHAAAKKSIKEIADKSIWIEQEDGSEVLVRWLNRVKLNKQTNCFDITFHPDMLPYLYDLKNRYTQYRLDNVLTMHSKYGIRLYEILKSYQYLGKSITFTIEELCKRLDAGSYSRYPDLRRFVIDAAVDDINACSDIAVSYTPVKTHSRGVSHIEFEIRELRPVEQFARRHEKRQRLTPSGKAERRRREKLFDEKMKKYENAHD